MRFGRPDSRSRPGSPAAGPGSASLRYLGLLCAALLTAAPALRADNAHSAVTPAGTQAAAAQSAADTKLNTITIEAARQKRELRRRVGRFVSSVVVSYMSESLPRWDQPICPLVAGLPRGDGEYILARITQVATAAHAPMAGKRCKPNLYVVATAYPDLLLQKWWDRDRLMYNECNGLGGVKEFLHSKQPIRVWYNTMPGGPNGGRSIPIQLDAPAIGLSLGPAAPCVGGGDGGTRLVQAPLAFSQAIVIVDLHQVKGLTLGQLANYVSMVGLAQILPDTHPKAGATILTLFDGEKHPPEGLTPWDRALLYALYHTRQTNPLQVSLMENTMVSRMIPSASTR